MKGLVFSTAACILVFAACTDKREAESSKAMIPHFRNEWNLLEVKPEDSNELWMFRKNLGAAEIKSHENLPTLVYFTVIFEPLEDTGLPKPSDLDALYAFEENVVPKVEKHASCVHVASVLKGGVKDHLFYVSDPDLFIRTVNRHRNALKDFKISMEKHHDPNWEVYADFPDAL